MKFLTLIFISIISACTAVIDPTNSQKSNSNVGIKNGYLVYEGTITEAANKAIFKAFNAAHHKPKRLLISSTGGELELGMELGSWVKHNNLDVEVANICASACANYVFPAGNVKYLRKGSILIWHGSAWQSNWRVEDKFEDRFHSYISSMREQETAFFAALEVDNLLCTYGQTKISISQRFMNSLGIGSQGYDYSLADIEKFGLKNIVLIDKEWDWRKYRPEHVNKVTRIKVDDDFKLKLRRF